MVVVEPGCFLFSGEMQLEVIIQEAFFLII